jgi:sodium transport system ATP-binding protein
MDATGTPAVRVEGLGKRFSGSGRWAVRGLSFSCAPGEVVGLLGENGAGKTTTLRMLATMLAPSEGDAEVCGHALRAAPERVRRSLGILFGGAGGLYERLTARENVLYYGELNGLSDGEARANLAAVAELLDMRSFLDTKAAAFSTGMRQKTLIARTIIHNPSLLLLDEPATGLDVQTSRSIHAFIRRFKELGKTVIFSSHDLRAVAGVSDSALILHRGTLQAHLTAKEMAGYRGSKGIDALEARFLRATEAAS